MGGEMNKKAMLNEMCYDCKHYPCPTLKNGDHCCTYNGLAEALEKQVPKKPKEYEDKFYACPICRNVLLHKWKKYNTELMNKSNGLPYCLNCGQKLDWSDEE